MSEVVTNKRPKVRKVKIRKLCETISEPDMSWRDRAKCLNKDVSLFVYSTDEPTQKHRDKLSSICEGCPVLMTCRLEGLRTLSEGWWGNMTPQERFDWAAETIFKEQLGD